MAGPYESKPGNARNGQVHHHPGLWRTTTRDYAIIIGLDWRPVLWWRDRDDDSTWQSRDMTGEFGLLDAINSHMAMALGVTWDARVVLAGNTHHDTIRWWRSAPGDPSSGWAQVTRPSAWNAWSSLSTYQAFCALSDGTLLMLCDHTPPGATGRAWSCLRLPAGSDAWETTGDANGNLMVAPHPTGQPDRSYILASSVDRDDVLHIVGVWRWDNSDPTTMLRPFHARSHDAGDTWATVDGTPLDVPFAYPATPDAAGILLDGESPGHTNGVSSVGVVGGDVVISGVFGGAQQVLRWDGEWTSVTTPTDAFTFPGVAVDWDGRGDLRVVGRRAGQLRAYRPDQIPGPHINLGAVNTGSAEETLWRSTAVYHPFIEHDPGGPLISWMVPDGDLPRIRTARTYRQQPLT